MSNYEDLEWPDVLHEIEPQTDVDRIRAASKTRETFSADVDFELQVGRRVSCFCSEVEVEMGESGVASLFVNGSLAWVGPSGDLRELATMRDDASKDLYGVAVNGRIVWAKF